LGRHGLSVGQERSLSSRQRLCQPHSPQNAECQANAGENPQSQCGQIRRRSRVEHNFAVQEDGMDLFIRTIGVARATTKIGMANIVYNIKSLLVLQKAATASA
jgi:hypothetical protein